MSKTLAELIDRAFDIKVFFELSSYELHHYCDGSYVDFRIKKIYDLQPLIRLAGGLDLKLFADDGFIIVRLFERDI